MLIHQRRSFGAILSVCRRVDRGERWAVGDQARFIGPRSTLFKRCFENGSVPAIVKISVEAISSGIAIGKHKTTPWGFVDFVDPIISFVEQIDEFDRMGWRATAVIDVTEVCNVRIVWFVKVDTIPAALEVYLRSHSVRAVRVLHIWRIVLDSARGIRIDADKRNSVGNIAAAIPGLGGAVITARKS